MTQLLNGDPHSFHEIGATLDAKRSRRRCLNFNVLPKTFEKPSRRSDFQNIILGIDLDEELKRSLYDINDVEEICPFFNIFRLSPSRDSIELSYSDLTDNYLSFSPVSGRTPEIKSPLNFDMASPINISNVGSYSPPSVSSILRGSMKNIQFMDFNSCHRRQVHGNQ